MPKVKRRRSIQRSALREIRKYQDKGKHATRNLVPKSCFNRLAREIANEGAWGKLRFREDAMSCLQEATESYITNLLKNANKIAAAQGRLTLQNVDLQLAKSILTNTNDDFSSYLKATTKTTTKKKSSAAVAPTDEAASTEDDSEDADDDVETDDGETDDADVEEDGFVVV